MNLRPDQSPMFQLVAALSAMQHRLDEALEPSGLSLAKFGLLARLASAGEPLPLRTLAERCACVRSNITQLVDRLEADGLVQRVHDPRDRRSVLAELTSEGRRRYDAALVILETTESRILQALDEPQRQSLLPLLRALQAVS